MNEICFSVASLVNIKIFGNLTKSNYDFIKLIYSDFDKPIENQKFDIILEVTDKIPSIEKNVKLGKDAYFKENCLVLSSGHFYIRKDNTLHIGVPSKVKRGRVPFKRSAAGRHITDEILEPILGLVLLENGAAFLHASSFVEGNVSKVIMGWRGTGKTNSILKELPTKDIWSDDLTIIDKDGFIHPYRRPIRIYSYNIDLLDKNYTKNNQLKLKSLFTPPWRPVHYLPLAKIDSRLKIKLGQLTYLNDSKNNDIAQLSEQVMSFEQLFFEDTKIMLSMANIFNIKLTTEDIVNSALSSIDS